MCSIKHRDGRSAGNTGIAGKAARRADDGRAPGEGISGAGTPPDPEMTPRAKRRRFSPGYKARIVEEADRCVEQGAVGALLRREGLYSSQLSTWREQYYSGALQALRDDKRGRKPVTNAVEDELDEGTLTLRLGEDGVYRLNDRSFTQVCSLAKVSKDTVNKLRPETATAVLRETLPVGSRPIQALVQSGGIRPLAAPCSGKAGEDLSSLVTSLRI